MKELTKKFIKLNNGENIICCLDQTDKLFDNKSVHVIDPVVIHNIRVPRMGMIVETFIMRPWIPLSTDDVAEIQTSSITAVCDPNEKIIEQYEFFLQDRKTVEVQSNEPEEMASEENYEEFIQSILGNREDNEEDETPGQKRILH